ncbi:hypothetical protein ACHAWF_011453 [Thalassiosira exigua]
MVSVSSTTSVISKAGSLAGTGWPDNASSRRRPSGPQRGSLASQRSVPPQFQPTAPSSSKVSRQLPSSRHFDSADPTARWTGTEAAWAEAGTIARGRVDSVLDKKALLPWPWEKSTLEPSMLLVLDNAVDDRLPVIGRPGAPNAATPTLPPRAATASHGANVVSDFIAIGLLDAEKRPCPSPLQLQLSRTLAVESNVVVVVVVVVVQQVVCT